MITDHAIVEREGFRVPLIGVPPDAMMQECELCHKMKPLREVQLGESGQLLCEQCRKP